MAVRTAEMEQLQELYEQRENDINKAGVNIVSSLAQALGCDIEDLLE